MGLVSACTVEQDLQKARMEEQAERKSSSGPILNVLSSRRKADSVQGNSQAGPILL
jgi:hypothetical protein